MWKYTRHKDNLKLQDLMVSAKIQEIAQYANNVNSEGIIENIKGELSRLKGFNSFRPELMYKAISTGIQSVEIWKLYPDGSMKEKLFTLEYDRPTVTYLDFI